MSQTALVKESFDLVHTISPEDFKKTVVLEADLRHIVRDFVRAQLEAEKDYGRIDICSRTGSIA